MTGPHKARKAGLCDRCGNMIAAGDDYFAGKAKCFGWSTRFATERLCTNCVDQTNIGTIQKARWSNTSLLTDEFAAYAKARGESGQ